MHAQAIRLAVVAVVLLVVTFVVAFALGRSARPNPAPRTAQLARKVWWARCQRSRPPMSRTPVPASLPLRAVVALLGASLCLVLPSCGGSGDSGEARTQTKALSPHSGRVETPEYAFSTRPRAPRSRVTLGGKRLSGRGGVLVVVRVTLANRRSDRLTVGQMNASLRSAGKSYAPILADGRTATEPAFAETSVAPSKVIGSVLVYRVPRRTLPNARLAVTDAVRHRSFTLAVFRDPSLAGDRAP